MKTSQQIPLDPNPILSSFINKRLSFMCLRIPSCGVNALSNDRSTACREDMLFFFNGTKDLFVNLETSGVGLQEGSTGPFETTGHETTDSKNSAHTF